MKWSIIDRVSSQVLYAVTGIVLARLLSPGDFGLVGAVLIFQAFASLMVDSGFSFALIQRKNPTQTDYSSVLWFNLAISVLLYAILYAGAPLIADCFQGDERLVPLSRVMFLTFILNGAGIVQTNRLTKQLNMRPVAIANTIGLIAGAVAGIWLAFAGFGPWAIVWQSVTLSGVKTGVLWIIGNWWPSLTFSWTALKSFLGVSMSMMATSLLNTIFLNLYSFIIGNRIGLASLGYYTQADKWSKMGIASFSQVITSSFLPVLSSVQDDAKQFAAVVSKMNRTTAYLLYPMTIGLMVMAPNIFHLLFGAKWDAAIILFQLLMLRGIFTILCGLYNNYILGLGHSRTIVWFEVLRDGVAIVALIVTWPYMHLSTADDPVLGIRIMLYGQVIASVVAWVGTILFTCRLTRISLLSFCRDNVPYILLTAIIVPLLVVSSNVCNGLADSVVALTGVSPGAALALCAGCALLLQMAIGALLYMLANSMLGSAVQRDAIAYLRGKKVL